MVHRLVVFEKRLVSDFLKFRMVYSLPKTTCTTNSAFFVDGFQLLNVQVLSRTISPLRPILKEACFHCTCRRISTKENEEFRIEGEL